MKIAYLAKEYPPYGMNFASSIFYPKLAKELVRRGHEVHIVAQAIGGETIIEEDGIIVHRVGHPSKEGNPLMRMIFNAESTAALRSIVKKNAIQIVESNVTFGEGFIYSFLKSTPLVTQSFAFSEMFLNTRTWRNFEEYFGLRMSVILEDLTLRRSDIIVANSPATYNYLAKVKKLSKKRLVLIPEARIDLTKWKFKYSNIRESIDIPPDAMMVLYVGWLQPRKGISILHRAMPLVLRQFPNTIFVLAGRDPPGTKQVDSYKSLIANDSIQRGFSANLRFIDRFLALEDLIKLYSATDVLAAPSLSETFGWPVIEAMACGKFVITTETGIAPEMKSLGAYIELTEPGDVKGFAKAIIYGLRTSSEKKMEIMTTNQKIVSATFRFEKMVDSLEQVYFSLVKSL